MGELTGSAVRAIAARTSRRGFLGKVGRGVVALAGGGFVAAALSPEQAAAHHICGHLYTTGSCPHPYSPLSRTDAYGYPMHPTWGFPVDDSGVIYTDRTTQVWTKTCQEFGPSRFDFVNDPRYGGGWTRCCSGRLRHIQDCCSRSAIRINGDQAVRGYCQPNLKVFCITYRELTVSC